jgi:energy-coupling factor transporter ATP-binding protein EcfA2
MILRRVSKLELLNFKGFSSQDGEPVGIDLDADLVLIMGPNGRGKTSIVEALELVATGSISQRVGNSSEFDISHFIHRNARDDKRDAAAKVCITWRDGGERDETIIRPAARPEDKVTSVGPWSAMRANEWARGGRANLLRTTAFLYSDALGSMLGLDLEARRQILDSYLPEGDRLSSLASGPTPLLKVEAHRDRMGSGLSEANQRNAAELAIAREAEGISGRVTGSRVALVGKGKMLVPGSLIRELGPVATAVGINITGASPDAIRALAASARAKSLQEQQNAEQSAHGEAPGGAERAIIQERLRRIESELAVTDVPSRARLSLRLSELGEDEALRAKKDEVDQRIARARAEQELMWSDADTALPRDLGRCPVGTLPLLATLARFRVEDPLPSWWSTARLPAPDPKQFLALLGQEVERWNGLKRQVENDEAERNQVSAWIAERSRLTQAAPLLQQLEEAWARRFSARPLPVREDGMLDKASLLSALEEVSVAIDQLPQNKVQPAHLRDLADVLGRWADAREQALAAAEENNKAQAQMRIAKRDNLESLAAFLKSLTGRGLGDLSTRLRARAVEKNYGGQMDDAMRRVLFGYAHPEYLVENAHASFNKTGHFIVRIGGESSTQTGIASLSRSQLTSVAFSLALAANLGQPDPPLGFVCLDDVSDAFDLDNLAADASILRMLAYGRNVRSRRQLIITNHNDELTDRIVPLLLPPAGCTMRVVQLVGGGVNSDVTIKSWRVRNQQSPEPNVKSRMREFYPPQE